MEKLEFVIAGKRGHSTAQLWLDGKELFPETSQQVCNHTNKGFEWGTTITGSSQTALAICLEIFPELWMAKALYQAFKYEFVSQWKDDQFELTINVCDFLIAYRGLYQLAQERQQWLSLADKRD